MTNFVTTIHTFDTEEKRHSKSGKLIFPSRGMAEHFASVACQSSTKRHQISARVQVQVFIPGSGSLLIDAFCISEAISALKEAKTAWDKEETDVLEYKVAR